MSNITHNDVLKKMKKLQHEIFDGVYGDPEEVFRILKINNGDPCGTAGFIRDNIISNMQLHKDDEIDSCTQDIIINIDHIRNVCQKWLDEKEVESDDTDFEGSELRRKKRRERHIK